MTAGVWVVGVRRRERGTNGTTRKTPTIGIGGIAPYVVILTTRLWEVCVVNMTTLVDSAKWSNYAGCIDPSVNSDGAGSTGRQGCYDCAAATYR